MENTTLNFKVQNCSVSLIKGNCIAVMDELPKQSVKLVATDLPYGITNNKWDMIVPFEPLWEKIKHVLRPDGIAVFTAAQPFASRLVMSNLEWFKYDLIWKKTLASGQLNVNKMPLRIHEHILVFYDKFSTYNEQKTKGEPYRVHREGTYRKGIYGKQTSSFKINDGFRHAKSILNISNPRIKKGHPTQKPVGLMDYIIKTYSNPGDVVLDCCMGSGTTGLSCINNNRNFIGIEIEDIYYNDTVDRFIKEFKVCF